MSEEGIIYIPNEAPRAKLPRKLKKKYIKHMGPNAYKKYLQGVPFLLFTSDYVNVNGVVFAPWNKKEMRKMSTQLSKYVTKPINPKYYKTIKINKDE